MSAKEKQIGGNHYKDFRIQPFDYITENNLGYAEGNVIKYVSRYKGKNGIEDLRKAVHYLELLIEKEISDQPKAWVDVEVNLDP